MVILRSCVQGPLGESYIPQGLTVCKTGETSAGRKPRGDSLPQLASALADGR